MNEEKHKLIMTPQLGVNEDTATLTNWVINDGEYVAKDTLICELETTKATFEVLSDYEGFVYQCCDVNVEIKTNEVIAVVSEEKIIDKNSITYKSRSYSKDTDIENIKVTKKAELLIKKHNIDVSKIVVENPIITEQDVIKSLNSVSTNEINKSKIKNNSILIYGAGQGGLTVLETINLGKKFEVFGFIDDYKSDKQFADINIFKKNQLSQLFEAGIRNIFIAVSEGKKRKKLYDFCLSIGFNLPSIFHPNCYVSSTSRIGDACHIKSGALIDFNCNVSVGSIIDNGVIIAHDCNINNFAHLAPGVSLGSNIVVGEYSIVGIGSSISTGIKIGKNCIVSVGSSVEKNINDNEVVQGVPCRVIGNKK